MSVRIAVLGGGVIGVTSALEIQKDVKNARVTIIAEKLTPFTTGDVSAGFWGPYLLGETKEKDIMKWSKTSHDKFLSLWKSGLAFQAGVSLIPAARFVTDKPFDEPSWIKIPFGKTTLTKEQLDKINQQFGKNFTGGTYYNTFTCEPAKLLPFLMEEFFQNGGNLVMKKVYTFDELLHDYDIVVNCTGPGAGELTGDTEIHLIRGQVLRVEAPWQYLVLQDESEDGNYIIPNMESVILGGTHQVDDTNLLPSPKDKDMIINGCNKMVPGLKNAVQVKDGVGLRPGREKIRLEIEKYMTGNNKILNIVHNYGHGGSGVTLCFGCAKDASLLVQTVIASKIRSSL